jgi:rhodanese-related sulfurtransferase
MDNDTRKEDAMRHLQNPGGTMITRKTFLLAFVAVGFLIPGGAVIADQKATEHDSPGVQHVNPNQAQKLVLDKKLVALDIRTPGEFSTGRIAGAKNIDFQAPDFEQRIDSLDKSKSYLVHCASGGRSTHSLLLFKKHQFQSMYHLDGGIKAWQKAGLPVEK